MRIVATVTRARIEQETSAQLIITSASARWFLLIALAFLAFSGASLAYLTAIVGRDLPAAAIIVVILLSIGLLLAIFLTITITLTFNNATQVMILTKEYLFGFGPLPRFREKRWSFQDIARVNHRTFFRTNNVELETRNNQQIALYFGANRVDAEKTAQKVASWLGQSPESTAPLAIGAIPSAPPDAYAFMQREIRNWGYWPIGLGVLHLIASGTFSPTWGIALIIIGLASFYFREAAMFVIYGVTMSWVALSNLLSGGLSTWLILGLLQIFWAYRLFRQFFAFKKAQAVLAASDPNSPIAPDSSRAARLFPWSGFILGSLSIIGFGSVFIIIFAMAFAGITQSILPGLFESASVIMAILGIAISLASLLSDFPYKVFAAFGLGAGTVVVLAELAFAVLS